MLGTPPETIADPVVIEIFGITDEFLEQIRTGGNDRKQLSGVPASSGVARGIARVLRSPDELPRLQQGDVWSVWGPLRRGRQPSQISACVAAAALLGRSPLFSGEPEISITVRRWNGTGDAMIRDDDQFTVDGSKGLK